MKTSFLYILIRTVAAVLLLPLVPVVWIFVLGFGSVIIHSFVGLSNFYLGIIRNDYTLQYHGWIAFCELGTAVKAPLSFLFHWSIGKL